MRLIVSGGGTGGHVYPILTTVDALSAPGSRDERQPATPAPANERRGAELVVCYAGTADGVEAAMAAERGIDFVPISAGQLRIRNPLQLARNSLRLAQGSLQARRLIRSWQPDVVFVTGGYVCAPVVWAAHRHHVPVLIYLPDVTPGMAVQRLARYATQIAVTFPEVAAFFPGKAIVTGYPVRRQLSQRTIGKGDARRTFDLDPNLPTLLIFGGSRGSRAINQATAGVLPGLLAQAQVIHITGEFDWPQARERAATLSPDQARRYRSFPYLHDEMAAALCAADLAVARAGASTLGEFPALGLPAVLVPLPISGQHQLPNARYLAERGAALIIDDADLPTQLLPTVSELFDHPDRLSAISQASAALARPDAADRIASLLVALAEAKAKAQPS